MAVEIQFLLQFDIKIYLIDHLYAYLFLQVTLCKVLAIKCNSQTKLFVA